MAMTTMTSLSGLQRSKAYVFLLMGLTPSLGGGAEKNDTNICIIAIIKCRCLAQKSSTSTWTSTRQSSIHASRTSLADTAGKGQSWTDQHSTLIIFEISSRWERFVHSENQHLVSPEALDFLDKLLRYLNNYLPFFVWLYPTRKTSKKCTRDVS